MLVDQVAAGSANANTQRDERQGGHRGAASRQAPRPPSGEAHGREAEDDESAGKEGAGTVFVDLERLLAHHGLDSRLLLLARFQGKPGAPGQAHREPGNGQPGQLAGGRAPGHGDQGGDGSDRQQDREGDREVDDGGVQGIGKHGLGSGFVVPPNCLGRHPPTIGQTPRMAASDPDYQLDDLDEASAGPGGADVLVLVVLIAVAGGGLADLVLDSRSRVPGLHLLVEALLIGASLTGIVLIVRRWRFARRQLAAAERDAAARAAERDAWRARAEYALSGLGREVAGQFDAWGLTGAERDTALRLIKGHSVRRIATETGRSEKTVRQHAVSVYRKSGLSGRAELAGFFLGGLAVATTADADEGRPAGPPRDRDR